MFLKKSSHKSKQRRPPCLSYCFNGSVVADSGDLETPAAADGDVAKRRASCFSWSWFRRKKSMEDTNNQGAKGSRCKPLAQPDRQTTTKTIGQVSNESQQSRLPQLTPKYDGVYRHEPPSPSTEPVLNRRKRIPSEPERRPITPRAKAPARPDRIRTLDLKAGLTVLVVTLAVMVLYGRAAAVVNLCACLYLAALLRQLAVAEVAVEKMVGAGDADVDSEKRKKKVVMEGFLERSKRRLQVQGSAFNR